MTVITLVGSRTSGGSGRTVVLDISVVSIEHLTPRDTRYFLDCGKPARAPCVLRLRGEPGGKEGAHDTVPIIRYTPPPLPHTRWVRMGHFWTVEVPTVFDIRSRVVYLARLTVLSSYSFCYY